MNNPQYSIRLRSSARTNKGQVRENNEDNIHLWARDNFVLAVVADGMGGAAAGEEASRIAVDTIQQGLAVPEYRGEGNFDDLTDDMVTQRLREAVNEANHFIVERAASSPDLKGMGTTVTLAFVRKTYAIVAHVGDSRAYLVSRRDNSIRQITSDHSFVEALLAAGHITPEQAEEHPMRNVLYRALGQAEEIDVDIYNTHLYVGDCLILCSDGLTRHVKPREIAEIALAEDNPESSSQQLIDLTNQRGGEDNVSVIVISVEEIGPTSAVEIATPVISTQNEDTLIAKDQEKQSTLSRGINDKPHIHLAGQLVNISGRPDTTLHLGADPNQTPTLEIAIEEMEDTERFFVGQEEQNDSEKFRPDTLDQAIVNRPDAMRAATPNLSPVKNPSVYDEGDGEGQDTLKPDQ
jgi:PPM family protein phosphatase